MARAPTHHPKKTSKDPSVERLKLFSIVDFINCLNSIINETSKIVRVTVSPKTPVVGKILGSFAVLSKPFLIV